MEVIFLGTGTSLGVPPPAHDCPGLDLSNPKNHRDRTCIHVVMDGLHIQVDAGPEFRLQCIREKIPAVDLFILTHGHADHILGMDDLRHYCDLRDGDAIPVYSTENGIERVKQIYPYAIRESSAGTGYTAFSTRLMPPVLTLESGSSIASTPLPHGRFQTLGLVFNERSTGARFAYFTDCKEVTPAARKLAAGADAVVLDGLRPREHPTHMNVAEAVAAAKRIRAKRSLLTHMTYEVDHDTQSALLAPQGVELAYDGLRLALP
jgi:phosphoribosyl 1,2-cyclic phosphate phosphodiesterase